MATLATLVVKLTADTGEFVDKMKSSEKSAGGFVDGIKKRVQTVGKVALGGLGVVAGAAGTAAVGLMELAKGAAPVEGLQRAFEGLAESSGQSADALLASLKEGSAGMVAQRDLMESYNKAAQLVGTTFANELPGAMQYLGKVSAATGQDMGFLLDSLVTGVGRLSPMILDNLGIQVNLTEATEAYAASLGKEASELTKSEQQAALMAQVMEKLRTNTAAMPEVQGTAAASMAQWTAKVQDLKDRVGTALLPVLNSLMGLFSAFLPLLEPLIQAFQSRLVPWLDRAIEAFGGVRWVIEDMINGVFGRDYPWEDVFPPGIADAAYKITEAIYTVIDAIGPYIQIAAEWIGNNVELQDVLIALGIAIASVVIPALISVVTAAAPVVATVVALIAIVVAMRKAWESDFLGVRTFVLNTMDALKTGIQNALNAIKGFWDQHGAAIVAKAKEIWGKVVDAFEWFKGVFMGIYDAFRSAFEGDWRGFGEKLRQVWDQVWAKIKEIGTKAWEAIKSFFQRTDWGSIGRGILEGIAKGITAGVSWLKDAARSAAQAALDAAKGFLGIDSPSKAFMQVGQFAAEGFAIGLARSDAIERAAAAMGSQALRATVAGAGPGGASYTYGGATYNIYDERAYRLAMEQERQRQRSAFAHRSGMP